MQLVAFQIWLYSDEVVYYLKALSLNNIINVYVARYLCQNSYIQLNYDNIQLNNIIAMMFSLISEGPVTPVHNVPGVYAPVEHRWQLSPPRGNQVNTVHSIALDSQLI